MRNTRTAPRFPQDFVSTMKDWGKHAQVSVCDLGSVWHSQYKGWVVAHARAARTKTGDECARYKEVLPVGCGTSDDERWRLSLSCAETVHSRSVCNSVRAKKRGGVALCKLRPLGGGVTGRGQEGLPAKAPNRTNANSGQRTQSFGFATLANRAQPSVLLLCSATKRLCAPPALRSRGVRGEGGRTRRLTAGLAMMQHNTSELYHLPLLPHGPSCRGV